MQVSVAVVAAQAISHLKSYNRIANSDAANPSRLRNNPRFVSGYRFSES